MSKFTKALEKIQQEKPVYAEDPKSTASSYAIAEASEDKGERWFRGVPQSKSAIPEYHIVTHHFSNSLAAEQYRMLRVNLKTHLDKEQSKVILISSAIHGEGKSVTAVNLAMTLAENGDARVALVDADLRRGRVADYLGLGHDRQGLSDLLANTNGLTAKKVMVRSAMDNMVIIPRGTHTDNASNLISTTKFRIFIEELRSHFDYIIVDSPPMMSVADAGILGREADGVLMVIQLGRTPKSIVAHSSLLFKQADVKLLGYVLTNVQFHSADYRYDYGYRYATGYGEGMEDVNAPPNRLKQVEFALRDWEAKLNDWWDKNVLKKKL